MPEELGSAPLPSPGPQDHIRGPDGAPLVIEYADFECPYCAVLGPALHARALRHVFRHFPVRSSHPRAWAAACAAQAAGVQERFWEMHDLLLGDQGRLEDPHLRARAERIGLDLARFEVDRRSDDIAARVREDFRGGVRAGVVTTPTLFTEGVMHAGRGALAALG